MNKINDILEIVNASLKTHYFKDIEFNKLVELVEKNGIKTPCKYIGAGEYIPILEDTQGLIVYHRLISFDNDEDSEGGFGRNPLTTETYKINTVFYGNQNAISNDVKDINQYLALEFKKLIPRKLDLGVTNTISVSSINYDKTDIADSEGIELIPENVLFSLELQIVLKIKENCNDLTCATEPFKYCQDVTIIDGDKVVEVEAGGTYICDPILDATVNVNGNLFDTVASGGILNVPVINEGDSSVGTIIASNIVVSNSDIYLNNILTQSVLSEEDQYINVINSVSTPIGSEFSGNWLLPDITHTDSDGTPTVLPAQVPMVCSLSATDIFLKFHWDASNDITDTAIIDSDSAGVYTSITDDGASGTITVSVNGGAYVAFSTLNPLTLIATDTIAFTRTITTGAGWVKLTGTY